MKTYFSLDFIPQGDYPASSHETFEHVFDDLGIGSIDFWAQGCYRKGLWKNNIFDFFMIF